MSRSVDEISIHSLKGRILILKRERQLHSDFIHSETRKRFWSGFLCFILTGASGIVDRSHQFVKIKSNRLFIFSSFDEREREKERECRDG